MSEKVERFLEKVKKQSYSEEETIGGLPVKYYIMDQLLKWNNKIKEVQEEIQRKLSGLIREMTYSTYREYEGMGLDDLANICKAAIEKLNEAKKEVKEKIEQARKILLSYE